EVGRPLSDAIGVVAVVVLVCLQNWRSAIIPLVAVPVAIIGTFAVMAAIGFSLNTLTLFGLVLAIGIVVDDAIVVVEAVEHHIEHGKGPKEATRAAMAQVSGPVIAVGLVLAAVFVPCAFITGITGQFYRQFALTIAVSTVISAFNSLTLSPALTALLLRQQDKSTAPPLPRLAYPVIGVWLAYEFLAAALDRWLGWKLSIDIPIRDAGEVGTIGLHVPVVSVLAVLLGIVAGWLLSRPLNHVLGAAFRGFNRWFDRVTALYAASVGRLLRASAVVLVVYAGLLMLTYLGFNYTPKGFIPNQDKGYLLVNVQ